MKVAVATEFVTEIGCDLGAHSIGYAARPGAQ